MAQSKPILVLNSSPSDQEFTDNFVHFYGNLAFNAATGSTNADTYLTNGLPFTIRAPGNDAVLYTQNAPFFGRFESYTSTTNVYKFDPLHNTIRVIVSGTELANGAAIGAGVFGDSVTAHIVANRAP